MPTPKRTSVVVACSCLVALLVASCGGGGAAVLQPTITRISPSQGYFAGGTTVTITGTNFGTVGTSVTFGGVPAVDVVVRNSTELTCLTPPGGAGAADVVVLSGGSSATMVGGYFYVAPGAPGPFTPPPDDDFFAEQWHLENTGQGGGTPGEDARVVAPWNAGLTGMGVRINVIDDGLEILHDDLIVNVIPGVSWDYAQNDGDPTPIDTASDHGTAVAGVAAAYGDNALGVSGPAPRAGLAGYTIIQPGVTIGDSADSLARDHAATDIYNNSWGLTPQNGPAVYNDMFTIERSAVLTGITSGRGGRGSLYMKAAGNGAQAGQDANVDGSNTTEGMLVIGAVDADGVVACYSAPGSCVLVTAHSGGCTSLPDIATTDIGNSYRGVPGSPIGGFSGTSSSTPLAAGVAALIVEANPALNWHDVARVMAVTARKTDPGNPSWNVNGAGHDVSDFYGYGVLDAAAAVSLAQTYTPTSLSHATTVATLVGAAIPDQPTTVNSSVALSGASGVTNVYYVVVHVTMTHAFATEPSFTLTSPDGHTSVLIFGHEEAGQNYMVGGSATTPGTARFVTWQHLDEAGDGTWTLRARDEVPNDFGTLHSWSIQLHGTN